MIHVVASLSGSALVSVNLVTLRRARLILGWVIVCGWVNHLAMYVTIHLGQLSLPSLRGRLIEYRLHLCRVAGNTV